MSVALILSGGVILSKTQYAVVLIAARGRVSPFQSLSLDENLGGTSIRSTTVRNSKIRCIHPAGTDLPISFDCVRSCRTVCLLEAALNITGSHVFGGFAGRCR